MASATSKITACGCAYCAAEMDGELFRNLSEKLPFEGACPRLWCRARLTDAQKERLRTYFAARPDIESLYEFLHETADLLRVRAQNVDSCRRYVAELLNKIDQLRKTPFAPLRTLGKTLHNWREEVARMFRFTRNNGITEGFHRKMKLIQRRAYGFRNFENYRLRVRVLCC